jgi:protein-tyrosine phosphatase
VVINEGYLKEVTSDISSERDADAIANDASYLPKSQSALSFTSNWACDTISTDTFKLSSPFVLPTSDINVDFECRNTANYSGWIMVTSLARVWFNAYFEDGHIGVDLAVFEIG